MRVTFSKNDSGNPDMIPRRKVRYNRRPKLNLVRQAVRDNSGKNHCPDLRHWSRAIEGLRHAAVAMTDGRASLETRVPLSPILK